MSISQDLKLPTISPYIELWEIDGHEIDGDLYWHFTSHSDYPIAFGGVTYTPFPIQGSGFEASSNQPPRPKLSLSNVTKYVQPFIQEHEELARVKVTRIRTLAKYLDGSPTADSSQMLPPEVFFIHRLVRLNNAAIEFELVSALELPGLKLPMGQVLRDRTDSPSNLWAPGLSTVRAR